MCVIAVGRPRGLGLRVQVLGYGVWCFAFRVRGIGRLGRTPPLCNNGIVGIQEDPNMITIVPHRHFYWVGVHLRYRIWCSNSSTVVGGSCHATTFS